MTVGIKTMESIGRDMIAPRIQKDDDYIPIGAMIKIFDKHGVIEKWQRKGIVKWLTANGYGEYDEVAMRFMIAKDVSKFKVIDSQGQERLF